MKGNNKLLHVCRSFMCPTFDGVKSGYCRNIYFLNQNKLSTDLTVFKEIPLLYICSSLMAVE